MKTIELNEVNLDISTEYFVASYPSMGFYHNTMTNNIFFVNTQTSFVYFICMYNDLPLSREQQNATGTITEDFALRLTKTILKNIK